MFERHRSYVMAVCNACGERSYPVDFAPSADQDRWAAGIRAGLISAGWGIDLFDAAYCPGCWPAVRRKQEQADDERRIG